MVGIFRILRGNWWLVTREYQEVMYGIREHGLVVRFESEEGRTDTRVMVSQFSTFLRLAHNESKHMGVKGLVAMMWRRYHNKRDLRAAKSVVATCEHCQMAVGERQWRSLKSDREGNYQGSGSLVIFFPFHYL
jgi:hypothetical protein